MINPFGRFAYRFNLHDTIIGVNDCGQQSVLLY